MNGKVLYKLKIILQICRILTSHQQNSKASEWVLGEKSEVTGTLSYGLWGCCEC